MPRDSSLRLNAALDQRLFDLVYGYHPRGGDLSDLGVATLKAVHQVRRLFVHQLGWERERLETYRFAALAQVALPGRESRVLLRGPADVAALLPESALLGLLDKFAARQSPKAYRHRIDQVLMTHIPEMQSPIQTYSLPFTDEQYRYIVRKAEQIGLKIAPKDRERSGNRDLAYAIVTLIETAYGL